MKIFRSIIIFLLIVLGFIITYFKWYCSKSGVYCELAELFVIYFPALVFSITLFVWGIVELFYAKKRSLAIKIVVGVIILVIFYLWITCF